MEQAKNTEGDNYIHADVYVGGGLGTLQWLATAAWGSQLQPVLWILSVLPFLSPTK